MEAALDAPLAVHATTAPCRHDTVATPSGATLFVLDATRPDRRTVPFDHPTKGPEKARPHDRVRGKGASIPRKERGISTPFVPVAKHQDVRSKKHEAPTHTKQEARSTKTYEAKSTKTCARRWARDDPSSRSTIHVLPSGRNESTHVPPRRTDGHSQPSAVLSTTHARVRIRRRVERRDGSVLPRDAPSLQAAVVVDPHTNACTFARWQSKTTTKAEARTQVRSTSSWPHERGFVVHMRWRNASLRTNGRSTWNTACVETTVHASKCFVRVCSRPFQDGSSCWRTQMRLPESAHSKCRSTTAKKERRCGPSC